MKQLRQLRQEQKITQKQMAEILGIERTTYTKYETGSISPNIDMLHKIADHFGVSVDYLLGRSESPAPSSLDAQLSDIDFALSGELRELTEEEKQDILDYVRFKRSQKRR